MYSNKYFPPQYFADKYFGTGSAVEGAVSGAIAAAATVVGAVTAIGVLRATVSSGSNCSATLTARTQTNKHDGAVARSAQRRRQALQEQIDEEDALIISMISAVLPYYATSSGGDTWAH